MEILESLYEGSQGKVRVGGRLGESFDIKGGAKQGCKVPPVMFNIFFDVALRSFMKTLGIRGSRLKSPLMGVVLVLTM